MMQSCSVVTALTLASFAHAAPVAFDNSAGVFVWRSRDVSPIAGPGPLQPGSSFDITVGPAAQPYAGTEIIPPHSAQMNYLGPSGNQQPGYIRSLCLPLEFGIVPGPPGYAGYLGSVPHAVPLGGVISGPEGFGYSHWAHLRDQAGNTPPTMYMLTTGGIVPAKVTLADGDHYGWVLFNYVGGATRPWQPAEWGYETAPNTPIRANTYACTAAGDYTADGVTNFADLNEVLSHFGGQYSFAELNTVLSNFGQACR